MLLKNLDKMLLKDKVIWYRQLNIQEILTKIIMLPQALQKNFTQRRKWPLILEGQ